MESTTMSLPDTFARISNESLQLHRCLSTLQEKFGLADLRVPMMVLVGSQSAGKTTLVEHLAKKPLGYTHAMMGTRCPVKYVLRRTLDEPDEVAYVGPGRARIHPSQVGQYVQRRMQEIENDPALDGVSSETFDVEICGPDQINLEILDLPGQRTMDGLNQSRKIDALAAKFARNPDNYVIAVVECKADAATLDTLKCIHDQIMAAQFDPTEGVPPPYTRKEEWIHRALIVVNKFDQILHRDGVATTPALKQCIDSYRRHLGNNFVIAALRANNMGWNDSSKLTENLQQANELEQTWLDKVLLSTEMDPGMRHAWDTWKYSEVFGQPVIVRRLIERWQSTIDHQMCNIESVLVRAVSKSESIAERLRKQLNYLQKDKPWLDQSVQKCLYSYWHDFCSTWRTLCDPCTRGCIPHHEFAQSLPEVPHQLNLTSCLSEHDSTQYEESIRIWKSYSTSTHSHFYRGEDVSCDLRADLKHAEEEWQRWHVFQQFARRQLDAASSNDDGAQLEQHSLTYLPFQDSVRQIIADFEACYAQRDLLRAAKGVDAVARLWKVFLYFIHGYSASTVSDDELRALRDPFTNTYSVNAAVSMVRKRMLMDVLNGMQPFIGTLKGMFRRYPMHVHRLLVGAYTDVHRPPKYRVLWGQQAFQDAITELFYRKIDERLDRVQTMWERNVRAMADSMAADLPIRFLMGYMSTPHEDMLLPSRSRDPPPRATSEIASHIRALPQDNGVQLVSADSPDVVKLTREEQKRDVLRTVRHELRDMFHITEDDRRRAVFGAVDMAVGANMQPEPQNPSNPNTEYIRNCAQEYYYLGMFMAVTQCESHLTSQFTSLLCEPFAAFEGEFDEIQSRFKETLKADLMQTNRVRDLQAELQHTDQKLNTLQEALNHVHQLKQTPLASWAA